MEDYLWKLPFFQSGVLTSRWEEAWNRSWKKEGEPCKMKRRSSGWLRQIVLISVWSQRIELLALSLMPIEASKGHSKIAHERRSKFGFISPPGGSTTISSFASLQVKMWLFFLNNKYKDIFCLFFLLFSTFFPFSDVHSEASSSSSLQWPLHNNKRSLWSALSFFCRKYN